MVGSLLNGGHIAQAAEAQELSQEQLKSMSNIMLAEAKIAIANPKLAANLAIADAAADFDMEGASLESKIQRVGDLSLRVHANSDADLTELLGEQDSKHNRAILSNLDFIFDQANK